MIVISTFFCVKTAYEKVVSVSAILRPAIFLSNGCVAICVNLIDGCTQQLVVHVSQDTCSR